MEKSIQSESNQNPKKKASAGDWQARKDFNKWTILKADGQGPRIGMVHKEGDALLVTKAPHMHRLLNKIKRRFSGDEISALEAEEICNEIESLIGDLEVS